MIDNYSRYILSYKVSRHKRAQLTVESLKIAAKKSGVTKSMETQLYTDDGSENSCKIVSEFLETYSIKKVLAQVDVCFSNSMIESFFKSLKHRCLYKTDLKTERDLK